jgi:hypothetical protein
MTSLMRGVEKSNASNLSSPFAGMMTAWPDVTKPKHHARPSKKSGSFDVAVGHFDGGNSRADSWNFLLGAGGKRGLPFPNGKLIGPEKVKITFMEQSL